MALWQRIKRFSRSVAVLAVGCLVLEQVLYSVVVPGYFRGVLVSPVFWGLFSGVCFYLLWRLDRRYFKQEELLECNNTVWNPIGDDFWKLSHNRDREMWEPKINPATGLLMCGGFDGEGNPYGVG